MARMAKIFDAIPVVGSERVAAAGAALLMTGDGEVEGRRTKNAQREIYDTKHGKVEVRSPRPRPASTYRANKESIRFKDRNGLPHEFDRATRRSIERQGWRKSIGRWDGVGSPNDLAAYRKQLAAEAAKVKPKRVQKKVAEVGPLAGAMTLMLLGMDKGR